MNTTLIQTRHSNRLRRNRGGQPAAPAVSAPSATTPPQPACNGLTLPAEQFALLSEADAEAFLAARYCALSEAGHPPKSALDLAYHTELEIATAIQIADN